MLTIYQYYSRFRYTLEGVHLRIFDERVAPKSGRPLTLDELGKKEGVTRERIRQLENPVRNHFVSGLGDCNLEAIHRHLSQSFDAAIPVSKKDFLTTAGWPFFPRDDLGLAGAFVEALNLGEVRDDYIFPKSFGDFSKSAVARFVKENAVEAANVANSLSEFQSWLSNEHWGNTLASIIDAKSIAKAAGLRPQSAPNQIVSYLRARPEEPFSLDALISILGFQDKNRNGIATQLAKTEISRSPEGGYVYFPSGKARRLSTSQLIQEFLSSKQNQTATLEEVSKYLQTKRNLKDGSLRAACNKLPLQTKDGVVSITDAARKVTKSPFLTSGMFFLPEANVWRLRLKVTNDHLRGLGARLPTALVSALRLTGGKTSFLISPPGMRGFCNWNSQSLSFSTLRLSLLDVSAEVGDSVFLDFDKSRELAVSKCGPLTAPPGLTLIKQYAGLDESYEDDGLVGVLGLRDHGLTLEELLRQRDELHLLF